LPDGARDFGQQLVAVGSGLADGVADAVAQVIVEQADGYPLQRPGGRGDLDNDVGAPGVRFDHPLQAAYLALDLVQPPEVVILAAGVTAGGPGGSDARRRAARIG
jgi:hypothetical protein